MDAAPKNVLPERDPNANLSLDLDYLLTEIVHCDYQYCPKLEDMHKEAIMLAAEMYEMPLHFDLVQCIEDQTDPESKMCIPQMKTLVRRCTPIVDNLLRKKRVSTFPDDYLQNYDGTNYPGAFWFEGAGDIWRRMTHGGRDINVESCNVISEASEKCLRDPTKPRDYCFRLYGHSLACRPGVHCPYLRWPIMKCLEAVDDRPDFQALSKCMKQVPHFSRCEVGYVPADDY